jgi:GNAT superfamily N-acetyltransferase
MLDIVQLAERPDLVRAVSGWIFDEWWSRNPEHTVETVERLLVRHMTPDTVPLTLVALLDGEPAGTLSLVAKDSGVEERPETPWVAAVLTLPAFRGRGIGTALMREAEVVARRMGLDAIYLITAKAADFYSSCGWEPLERYTVDDPDDLVMVRKLRDNGGRA